MGFFSIEFYTKKRLKGVCVIFSTCFFPLLWMWCNAMRWLEVYFEWFLVCFASKLHMSLDFFFPFAFTWNRCLFSWEKNSLCQYFVKNKSHFKTTNRMNFNLIHCDNYRKSTTLNLFISGFPKSLAIHFHSNFDWLSCDCLQMLLFFLPRMPFNNSIHSDK